MTVLYDEATDFERFTSSSETTITRFRHLIPNFLHLCTVSECQLPSHSRQRDILSRDVSLVDETHCREHLNTSISLGVFRSASFTVSFRVVPSDKRYAVFVDPAGPLLYCARGMLQTSVVEP